MTNAQAVSGSFRDPSGFLYKRDGVLLRQVNHCYKLDYEKLMSSGLYEALIKSESLISHEEVDVVLAAQPDIAYQIVKPRLLEYISYPYEWCFSQLKDAALLTLNIQLKALKFGMSLKDASAYNIQFEAAKPVFIDTLSFEAYNEGAWVAYKQFCQHFLAPLALKSKVDRRLSQLLRTNIDGIPLDLASQLLPAKSWLSFSLATHIHLHARAQARYADDAKSSAPSTARVRKISKRQLKAIIEQLISAVKGLEPLRTQTEWGDYYQDTNYLDQAMLNKIDMVASHLLSIGRKDLSVIDMGANNGQFSRVASPFAKYVISQDIDEVAVEKNYLECKKSQEHQNILPLIQDLTNPSPAIGWATCERLSLMQRGKVDVIMALALIHHIALSNNVPLREIARFFKEQSDYLLIEFVPKSDSQVKRLLATREDIFSDYTQEAFEAVFGEFYEIKQTSSIANSERTLYLLRSKKP